jgi:hypothetical protein
MADGDCGLFTHSVNETIPVGDDVSLKRTTDSFALG